MLPKTWKIYLYPEDKKFDIENRDHTIASCLLTPPVSNLMLLRLSLGVNVFHYMRRDIKQVLRFE